MNRTAIKNFATWARRTLREQVRARAAQFGISPSEILAVQAVGGGLIVAGQTLNADEAEGSSTPDRDAELPCHW